jgi:hypothetical protein
MTWRSEMNRRRKARNKLRAVARPQEGAAAASQPIGVSSNSAPAGSSPQVTAGALSRGAPTRKPGPLADASLIDRVRALAQQGLADPEIGALLGATRCAVQGIRYRNGIAAGATAGRGPGPATSGYVPGGGHAARYAAFFVERGPYPSFTETQIRRYERRWAVAHPPRAPGVIDVAPRLHGDPVGSRSVACE